MNDNKHVVHKVKVVRKGAAADEEARYTLTPKGIALISMIGAGLIEGIDDPAFDIFWRLFTNDMKRFGYVKEDME